MTRLAPAGVRAWWRGKPPRERRTIAAFTAVAAIAIGWLGVVDPLSRDLARVERVRGDVARTLAEARADAVETTALARTPAAATVDGRAALERALAEAGLRPAVTHLEWQDRRAVLTFGSVEFARLVTWLESVHRNAGLHVREATLSRLASPGLVRAELVLAP